MRRRALLAVAVAAACVLGHRATAPFQGTHDLTSVDGLRIDLPSTPITVVACDPTVPATCPPRLTYDGVWVSTGGTAADARRDAERPGLVFERVDAYAELRADIPSAVRGLVDLELGEVSLPDDRDLDLRTDLGDVRVVGTIGAVTVDVGTGNVEVSGGDAGIGVRVDHGAITVTTAGHVDLRSGQGGVEVTQLAGPRDVVVWTSVGDVHVELASDADIDLSIHASGDIRVATDRLHVITSGHYERRTGTASTIVDLHTGFGSVEVVPAG